MDGIAKLISALAALAWPVLLSIALWNLRDPIKNIFSKGGVTFKILGNEINIDKFGEDTAKAMDDLRAKIGEIEARLPAQSAADAASSLKSVSKLTRVLWVDDNPSNNTLIVAGLDRDAFDFKFALSTDDAMREIDAGYDRVITDMARLERGFENRTAGLDLLRLLQGRNLRIPTAVFSSSSSAKRYGEQAMVLGAAIVTSSPTEIANFIRAGQP